MAASTWVIGEEKILQRDEIIAVIEGLKRRRRRSVNTRQNLVIFRLATCCGLRACEISGLKIKDLKGLRTEKPYINLRKVTTKGKKPRRVPLWWDIGTRDDLMAWLDERKEQGGEQDDCFVCSQSTGKISYQKAKDEPEERSGRRKPFGRQLSTKNLRHRFISCCKDLGPDRQATLTIHHGRHSFISHALYGGRSPVEVQRAAGHSSLNTTSIYAHLIRDEKDVNGHLFDF